MRRKKLILLLSIYLLLLIGMGAVILSSINRIYNTTYYIDDREAVITQIESSVPISIEYSSERWGSQKIEDIFEIDYITSLIEYIKTAPEETQENKVVVVDNHQMAIGGTIHYLTGKNEQFFISDKFILDDIAYDIANKGAEFKQLKAILTDSVVLPERLASFVNPNNKIVIFNDGNINFQLTVDEKQLINKSISDCNKINDASELSEALRNKGEILYHIKIYPEQLDKDIFLANNVINIDIFENQYFVVTDMMEESWTLFHMTGDLVQKCKEIIKRRDLLE